MTPIRTALIGLSASAKTSWASNAHLPYLLSPLGRSKYQIVALLNSSVSAARAAIATYDLDPATTKAYGSPADLAADPDVDLVVCCTRVDLHYDTVRASIEAGKNAYVEWPLAQNVGHARDLAALARDRGVRTAIGLQGRLAPPVLRIRDLIASGRVGKVLSVEVRAFGGTNDRVIVPRGLDYFLRREVGGNIYTIGFAHLFDLVQEAVGQAVLGHGHFQLQRPEARIRDPKTGEIEETVRSDVPDLINVVGTIETSPTVQEGAQISVRLRRGAPFPGDPPLVWAINGERGEIRLTATTSTSLHAAANVDMVPLEVHSYETNEVERLGWDWSPWQEELPVLAKSVGAVYEAFAEGKEGGYPTFEDALARHEQLESLISHWRG